MKKRRGRIGRGMAIRHLIFGGLFFLMIPVQSTAQGHEVSLSGTIETRDGYALRYGVWHCTGAPARGSVVLLGGRTEFMEKYTETIAELNQRGFEVYSFDWRGQGLSSRMLPDRHKGFVKTYDLYIADLALFIDSLVEPAAPKPVIMLAHSMGAHIALRYLHDYPQTVKRAVLVSPMFDILTSPFPRLLARLITRWMVTAGLEQTYAVGNGDYSPDAIKFEGNRLTGDPQRFMDEQRAIDENPDLALGGVTYGWLAATFESIDRLTAPGFAEKVTMPILILGAGDDRIVSVEAQKKICAKLGRCRFVSIPHARHEILKETDTVRAMFWKEFDRFIDSDPSK